jgi:hypothetical protein
MWKLAWLYLSKLTQELMLRDFAFWLYVFATPAFYCGITMLDARSHMDHVVYMVCILIHPLD